jgi:hypothetical protein
MTHGARRRLAAPEFPRTKPTPEGKVRLPRICLNCKAVFDSAWAGERVCPRCKATTGWRNGASVGASNFGQSNVRSGRRGSS